MSDERPVSRPAVTKYYLHMLAPSDLRPAPEPTEDVTIRRLDDCPIDLYRRLYREVGAAHHWVDRLPWTNDDIRRHLADPNVMFHVMSAEGEIAGYFELVKHDEDSIEIGLIGLIPRFIGRGLGGHLLTVAVRRAWAAGARMVWVTTLTLDHAAALPNYVKRGFVIYKEEPYPS